MRISRRDFLRNLLATVPAIAAGKRLLLAQTLEAEPEIPAAVIQDFDSISWCCKIEDLTELATYRTSRRARLLNLVASFDTLQPDRDRLIAVTLSRDDEARPILYEATSARMPWRTDPSMCVMVPAGGELTLSAKSGQPDLWCCGSMLFDLD